MTCLSSTYYMPDPIPVTQPTVQCTEVKIYNYLRQKETNATIADIVLIQLLVDTESIMHKLIHALKPLCSNSKQQQYSVAV